MLLKVGNLWDSKDDVIAVTTNSCLNNGQLVMGAGAAKQAKLRYPELPAIAGHWIKEQNQALGNYGWFVLKVSKNNQSQNIGFFQTKRHFQHDSTLEIIQESCNKLIDYLIANPGLKVSINFPGIGYGNLARNEVLPVILSLPDSVSVYEKNVNSIINSKVNLKP